MLQANSSASESVNIWLESDLSHNNKVEEREHPGSDGGGVRACFSDAREVPSSNSCSVYKHGLFTSMPKGFLVSQVHP